MSDDTVETVAVVDPEEQPSGDKESTKEQPEETPSETTVESPDTNEDTKEQSEPNENTTETPETNEKSEEETKSEDTPADDAKHTTNTSETADQPKNASPGNKNTKNSGKKKTSSPQAETKAAQKKKQPVELTIPAAKKELESIAKFGSKARPAVKNNLARATEMGFELIRKHNDLKQENESFLVSERVFKELQAEYFETSAVSEDLVTHLEDLVGKLVQENKVLKETFKANGLEVPIKDQLFPALPKKETKKQANKPVKNGNKTSGEAKKGDKKPVKAKKEEKKTEPIDSTLSDDDDWAAN